MKKYLEKLNKILSDKKITEIIFIVILLGVSMYTRFYNLGYSDYIGDEHKAFIELEEGQSYSDFFMSKRKGPMQFLVSQIPYLITGDLRNELAERIPFSIASVASVLVFYFVVKKLTKNSQVAAFIAAFLLAVNGFMVGFGRIAQYQNLNLLFSFLALFFYADLIAKKPSVKANYLKSSLLGTFFWCLSMLSHWDAVFILPVVAIIFLRYLRNAGVSKNEKTKLLVINVVFGCLVLLPFLVPYTGFQASYEENMTYFGRRIELGYFNFERYKLLTELYNPFVTFYALCGLGLLGMFLVKKSYMFTSWFLFAYLSFEFFVRKPGTHIYNFVIPATILSALAITQIFKVLPKAARYVWAAVVVLVLAFLFYQTHYIFIDHAKEYPWEQKTFVDFHDIQEKYYKKKKVKTRDRVYTSITTPKYNINQKLPLFGFPHKRYWNEINDYIQQENAEAGETLAYSTNEVKTISEWYIEAPYGAERPYYLVGIKKPLSFFNDYKFPQIGRKSTIHEIENEFGVTVVRIYKVRDE